jgi:hypothetical protein
MKLFRGSIFGQISALALGVLWAGKAHAVSPLNYSLTSRSAGTSEKVLSLKPLSTHFCFMTGINMPSAVGSYKASEYGYLGFDNNGNWALHADYSANTTGQPQAMYSATCIQYSQAESPNMGSRGSWNYWGEKGRSGVSYAYPMIPTPDATVRQPICAIGGLSGRFFDPDHIYFGHIWSSYSNSYPSITATWQENVFGLTPYPLNHCFDLQIDHKPGQKVTDVLYPGTYYIIPNNDAAHANITQSLYMSSASSTFCYLSELEATDPTPGSTFDGQHGVGAQILLGNDNHWYLTTCPNNIVNGSTCSPGTFGGTRSVDTMYMRATCVSLPILTQ